MWLLFARAAPPDAPQWPGRRWLSAVDAVAWPGMAWTALDAMVGARGLGPTIASVLLVTVAARRLSTALLANRRYRFTACPVGRLLVWTVVVGIFLRLGLAPSAHAFERDSNHGVPGATHPGCR